eukprot:6172003-Prymnesium_polylepis.1
MQGVSATFHIPFTSPSRPLHVPFTSPSRPLHAFFISSSRTVQHTINASFIAQHSALHRYKGG